jgi:hypothetical protein
VSSANPKRTEICQISLESSNFFGSAKDSKEQKQSQTTQKKGRTHGLGSKENKMHLFHRTHTSTSATDRVVHTGCCTPSCRRVERLPSVPARKQTGIQTHIACTPNSCNWLLWLYFLILCASLSCECILCSCSSDWAPHCVRLLESLQQRRSRFPCCSHLFSMCQFYEQASTFTMMLIAHCTSVTIPD